MLVAALRGPAVLAETAATLDVLSAGRLDLGVGVGRQAAEYDAAGLAFADRGRLLDQALEVCQLLWRQPAATYAGAALSFTRLHQMPKPAQEGGVPVWVSGTVNRRAMRRLARYGTGWIPWARRRRPAGGGGADAQRGGCRAGARQRASPSSRRRWPAASVTW